MSSTELPDPLFSLGEDGTPRSAVSDDVYFSVDGGLDESRHVFIDGIRGREIWPNTKRERIGELGFGTGLNFLVTWHDWLRLAPADATLDYAAVEGFPIPIEQLRAALRPMSSVLPETTEFLDAYPVRVGGYHRLLLAAGRVRLTLMYGDVEDMLGEMRGSVDAWYLDGFAPSKNADMWSPDVLEMVAKHTAPGGRIATFSAAGAVRRGLAAHGFDIVKRPGFGRKRECVAGQKQDTVSHDIPARVAVVGAGIAGTCAATSIAARGADVTLIDGGTDLAASGNPGALIAPRLPREQTPMGQIMARCFLFAIPFYDRLRDQGVDVWHGARGAFAMARDDREAERQQRAKVAFGWPDSVMRLVDPAEASRLTGGEITRPGVWFPGAGTLNPRGVVRALRSRLKHVSEAIGKIVPDGASWDVFNEDARTIGRFDAVILAAGADIQRWLPDGNWPIRPNRGQIAYVTTGEDGPKVPITYGGYYTPEIDLGDGQRGHVVGATYARRDEIPEADWNVVRPQDAETMIAALDEHIPRAGVNEIIGGRTALRATVRDYLPLVGSIAPDQSMIGGLGSRGFLTAPLMAELLADQIFGNVAPVEGSLADAVRPTRFG